MYQSIIYYINRDPNQQRDAEHIAAIDFLTRKNRNRRALTQSVTAIAPILERKLNRYSLVANANAKANICLTAAGALLYGEDPEAETLADVAQFLEDKQELSHPELVLVISGIGLGHHLLPLVDAIKPKYVLIYEPEPEFLNLSLNTAPWSELLTLCQQQSRHIFLQVAENASNMRQDLAELYQAFPNAAKPVFFQHLSHASIDHEIYCYLNNVELPISTLSSFLPKEFIFPNPKTISRLNLEKDKEILSRFNENILWLEKHQPELSKNLKNRSPENFHLTKFNNHYALQDKIGRIVNISYNKSTRLKKNKDSKIFDPVVFDLSLPEKLQSIPFAALCTEVKQLQQHLPDHDPSMCNYAEHVLLGVADFASCLNAIKTSQKLFVLELERDFLLASLYVVPWSDFKGEIYFAENFSEIENKIIGCYKNREIDLINIFINFPYYESNLRENYQKLLEIVQISNGKANYFEKQLTTLRNLYKNRNSGKYLAESNTMIFDPVIIVGNGPSLNQHLATLKSLRKKYILFSCGSALTTLHRSGLTPDYHLELERGTDTLEQLQKLPPSYLSRIELITPTDQLPATAALFRSALFTTLTLNDLTRSFPLSLDKVSLKQLEYSYYTVTNFAVDFLLSISCQNIYLVGVDFGFKHLKAHHAENSLYFNEQGRELYDFELAHGNSYEVAANFGGSCLTVPPFDIARKLMEKRIACAPTQCVFNCNDGAYIKGALAQRVLPLAEQPELDKRSTSQIRDLFKAPRTQAADSVLASIERKVYAYLLEHYHFMTQNNHLTLRQAIISQRRLLETYSVQHPVFYALFDGSLRYAEMVSGRLHYLPDDHAINNRLRDLWQLYLLQLTRFFE